MTSILSIVSGIRRLLHRRMVVWGIRIVVTAAILFWLQLQLNIAEFKQITLRPDPIPLVGLVLFALIFVLIGVMKFWVLFQALAPVPFYRFMRHFLVATSLGAFTPASLGDFSLAAFLKRERIPVQQSMALLIVDRVITLSIYTLIFIPLTLGLLLQSMTPWWIPLIGGLLISGVLLLHSNVRVRQGILLSLRRHRLEFLSEFFETISNLFQYYQRGILWNIILTLGRCLVGGMAVQCALWAAGEYQSFFTVLAVSNSLSVLNLIPVSFGGLGVYEGGGVAIFRHLGFDQERVLAGLLYQRLYVIGSSLVMLGIARLFFPQGDYLSTGTDKTSL